MEQIVELAVSWQFLTMGVAVALIVTGCLKVGEALWKLQAKWLRIALRTLNAATPWLPGLVGAGLGALPWWPRPEAFSDLPEAQGYMAMIILGLLAGVFYERIWKGVRQVIEARGISLDLDLPPRKQGKQKERVDD